MRKRKVFFPLTLFVILLTLTVFISSAAQERQEIRQRAQTVSFRFTSSSDVEAAFSTIAAISNQMKALNPNFAIFPGDTCDPLPISSCWNGFQQALNGNNNNGMGQKWFISRGNHERDESTSYWPNLVDWSGMVTRVGGSNFSGDDFNYSFDYGNSHIVALDLLAGGATSLTSSQMTWLDNDLTQAESRGLQHAFIFFHGPIYTIASYCCTQATNVTTILNKHPIVSATIHGHEHTLSHTHIDSSKISNVTHPFEQFTSGGGRRWYLCM